MKTVDLRCRSCGAKVVRQTEGFVCCECNRVAEPEVFISYHGGGSDPMRSSLPNALRLKEHLEERGIPAFVCKAENRADFRSAISEALRDCNHFILVAKDIDMILTSGWVFYELNTFDTYIKNSRNPSYAVKKPRGAVFTAFLYGGITEADLVPHTDVFLGSDVVTNETTAYDELYLMLKRAIEEDCKTRKAAKREKRAALEQSPVSYDSISPFIFKEVEGGYSVSMSGALALGCAPSVLSIPRRFASEPVVEVSDGAFAHCEGVKRVIIPDTVRKIGNCAFAGMASLESIELSERLELIESGAFMDCISLRRISLPEGLSVISDYCFAGCTNLIEVSLPSTLSLVGKGAFQNCVYLRHNELNGAKYLGNAKNPHILLVRANSESEFRVRRLCRVIGEKAFFASEARAVTIPRTVVSISDSAFAESKQLQAVKIDGSSLLHIGASAFYRCVRLSSLSLPDSVEFIGEKAFMNCLSLSSFKLPRSLSSLSRSVFSGCSSLSRLAINEKLRTIEDSALRGTVIEQVELSDAVEEVGVNAFVGCSKLSSVILPKSLAKKEEIFFESDDVKLYYSDNSDKPLNIAFESKE